jgi:hypothetical protein
MYLLLNSIRVLVVVGSVDDLISQALSNGFKVAESLDTSSL